jgi:pimeloyl-ACP methyl ester carboxylesterase
MADAPGAAAVRLAHRITGEGPPLMMIAGTGFPGATWHYDDLLGPLSERFTVITFDHRGTGDSPATPGPYSTRLFAADALALLRELDLGPAHIVGHSMGGRVAQWLTLDAPGMIRSMVLAATGPGQFRDDQAVTRGIPITTCMGLIEHGYEGYIRRHIRATFFTPEFAAIRPEVADRLADAFWQHRPSLEDYLKHVIARQTHQTAHLLSQIRVPSLVLVGDHDTERGGTGSHVDQSRYLAAHLPGATLRVIEGTSHGYFWQAPHIAVQEIIQWVDSRFLRGCTRLAGPTGECPTPPGCGPALREPCRAGQILG